MKKILFAMTVLFGCATVSFAQVTFVATLQHEGEFTVFYNSSALQQAYNAAVNGDTITLSGGNFSFSGSFEKGVTVRGTGFEHDLPTVLTSEMTFRSKDAEQTATFEGVQFGNNTYIYNSNSDLGQGRINFIKCLFNSEVRARYDNSYSTEHGPITRFNNCILRNRMYFEQYSYPYFVFTNSYVYAPHCSSSISANLTAFENCVISYRYNSNGVYSSSYYYDLSSSAYYLNFYNSIIIFDNNPNYDFPSTATAINCLSIGNNNLFQYLYNNSTNRYANNIADVFTSYVAGYTKGDTFELTETAASTYLGTDGTQMGMQGGVKPYTPVVQYPVITTLQAGQTTKEGILNVEVGVDE